MDGDSLCPVVSPAILQQVENLPPSTNPDFDLGMSEFFITQSSSANESSVGMKRCATSCEMDDMANKKRLRSSLRKNQKPIQECFSSVTCEEIKEVAKGVVPANTKSSNEWALKILRAWISDCNTRMSDEAVPADRLACEDADILCKWMCCFVQEMRKENGENYPPSTLRQLLPVLYVYCMYLGAAFFLLYCMRTVCVLYA